MSSTCSGHDKKLIDRPILLGTKRYYGDSRRESTERATTSSADDMGERASVDEPHEDEEQVLKDTHRSFVSYPKGELAVPGSRYRC